MFFSFPLQHKDKVEGAGVYQPLVRFNGVLFNVDVFAGHQVSRILFR
jgi:hypothetical protein